MDKRTRRKVKREITAIDERLLRDGGAFLRDNSTFFRNIEMVSGLDTGHSFLGVAFNRSCILRYAVTVDRRVLTEL